YFYLNRPATSQCYTLSLHDALPIYLAKNDLALKHKVQNWRERLIEMLRDALVARTRERLTDEQVTRYAQEIAEHKRDPYSLVERSEEHTSELQSRSDLVCRLLLEKK